MFKILLKQFAIIVLIILAVLSSIFGALLPWQKSTAYINTLTDLQSGKSFTQDQFEQEMGGVLNSYSPIGQEEVVKFFSSDVLNIINQPNFPVDATRFLVTYAEPYLFQNNVRHLIFGATAYETLWLVSHSESDYQKSEAYFLKAYAIGRNLPPVLYSMFDLYIRHGDKEKAKKIGLEILNYWPDDASVRKIVSSL